MSKRKSPALLVNLDGTVASCAWRQRYADEGDWARYYALAEFDPCYYPLAALVNSVRDDVRVLVIANHEDNDLAPIKAWLERYGVSYHHLYGIYATTVRHLDEAKVAVWRSRIRGHYDVRFILESNPACYEMWRAQDVACQYITDPALPVSAGNDTLLSAMGPPDPNPVCGRTVYNTKTCNRSVGHPNVGQDCSTFSESAWQETFGHRRPVTSAPASGGGTGAPKILSEIGDKKDAVCGKTRGDQLCIRHPHANDGPCFFVDLPAPDERDANELMAEMYGMGWGM